MNNYDTPYRMEISSIEYNKIEIQYDNVLDKVKKWEASVREKFSFGDSIVINSMLAYLNNKENGFSAYNDKDYYESLRSTDVDNLLYNEAKYGSELYKQLSKMGPIVWKRRGYKRN